MDLIIEMLKKRAFDIFDADEISEPLLMIYQHLTIALRDHNDTVTLNRSALTQTRNGVHIYSFPRIYDDASIYDPIRAALSKILDRDDLIKQYFRIDHIDQDNIILRTVKPQKNIQNSFQYLEQIAVIIGP